MHREAVETLPTLLGELEAPRPILIGHSDGASIALIHAATYPVTGLVLLAPHVFVEDLTLAGIRRARESFIEGPLRERMARHHRDPAVTFNNWCDVWLDPNFRSWNIEGLLASVTVPALLVQGDEDQYGTHAQLEAIERGAAGRTSRLVVAGGHSPHLAAPEQVLAAVNRFVERLD